MSLFLVFCEKGEYIRARGDKHKDAYTHTQQCQITIHVWSILFIVKKERGTSPIHLKSRVSHLPEKPTQRGTAV